MKRKELEKLPVLQATLSMAEQAKKEPLIQAPYYRNKQRYAHDFYARCKQFGNILKVAFYKTENLAAGGRQPRYEVFLDRDEQNFLTYSYLEKKWRTSMLCNLSWQGDYFYDVRLLPQDEKRVCGYLNSEERPIRAIQVFQKNIREKQLLARHKKETDPWDAAMALVPTLPKDWDKWVSKVGVEQNYMFYQYRRGGAKSGYCSYCDREVPIRNPKNNTFSKCPRCKKTVQFKAFGKMGSFRTARNKVYLLQPYPNGFVIRQFGAQRAYSKDRYQNVAAYFFEERRAIFDAECTPVKTFCWGMYKQKTSRWIEGDACSLGYSLDDSGRVYGKTIPCLAKSVLQRTGLPELIHAGKRIDPEKYLIVLKKVPEIERLSKAGLFRLTRECTISHYWLEELRKKNPQSKGLAAMLGIDRSELARLRQCDGGKSFLEWLQFEKTTGQTICDQAICWMCREQIKPEHLQFMMDRMRVGPIRHYMSRQMAETGMSSREMLGTWRDYLSMAARFGYDTKDPIIFRVRKLKQRHDELAAHCDDKLMTLRAGEILQTYPHIEENYHSINEKYAFADEPYLLCVPNTIEEVLMEGRKLCHCIANSDTYWERIERKESYLFFVRRAQEPDQPYYTVEAEPDGTVRQVRTFYNRQNEDVDAVRAFLRKWQKQLSIQLSEKEKELAKDSHALRIKELTKLRSDQITIHTGELAGRLLVDVLTEDLMEAA